MNNPSDRPVLSLTDLESFDPSAPERGRERRFCCPLPGCADKRRDARHRSLSVNVESGRWHCHRCGAGGLLRENWSPREPRFNAKRASSRRAFALTRSPEAVTVQAPTRPLRIQQDRWLDLFEAAVPIGADPGAAYLISRGISQEAAAAAGVRYMPRWPHWSRTPAGDWILAGTSRRVVFPIQDPTGRLVGIQGRVIGPDERGLKMLTRGALGAGVFRTNARALDEALVTLVEAPIDALTLQVAGVSAVALCGTNIPDWLPGALAFRRIALGFDADAAGDTASTRASGEFRAIGCQVERWRPNRKDWNEVLMTFGIETLTRELQRGSGASTSVL
jgi:hypothetical protein